MHIKITVLEGDTYFIPIGGLGLHRWSGETQNVPDEFGVWAFAKHIGTIDADMYNRIQSSLPTVGAFYPKPQSLTRNDSEFQPSAKIDDGKVQKELGESPHVSPGLNKL